MILAVHATKRGHLSNYTPPPRFRPCRYENEGNLFDEDFTQYASKDRMTKWVGAGQGWAGGVCSPLMAQRPERRVCFVLYAFVLYAFVLYAFVLYASVLYASVLYASVLYAFVLYAFVLYAFVLYAREGRMKEWVVGVGGCGWCVCGGGGGWGVGRPWWDGLMEWGLALPRLERLVLRAPYAVGGVGVGGWRRERSGTAGQRTCCLLTPAPAVGPKPPLCRHALRCSKARQGITRKVQPHNCRLQFVTEVVILLETLYMHWLHHRGAGGTANGRC